MHDAKDFMSQYKFKSTNAHSLQHHPQANAMNEVLRKSWQAERRGANY